jgi:hypothetical protein
VDTLPQRTELASGQYGQSRLLAKARAILDEHNVPFDFDPDRVDPALVRKSVEDLASGRVEMRTSRQKNEPLGGVELADTLGLPEKVDLGEDTVIIAKQIRFASGNPVIRGNHKLFIFAGGISYVDESGKPLKRGRLTIDTSPEGADKPDRAPRDKGRGRTASIREPIIPASPPAVSRSERLQRLTRPVGLATASPVGQFRRRLIRRLRACLGPPAMSGKVELRARRALMEAVLFRRVTAETAVPADLEGQVATEKPARRGRTARTYLF